LDHPASGNDLESRDYLQATTNPSWFYPGTSLLVTKLEWNLQAGPVSDDGDNLRNVRILFTMPLVSDNGAETVFEMSEIHNTFLRMEAISETSDFYL
jgi:hypothetical protein